MGWRERCWAREEPRKAAFPTEGGVREVREMIAEARKRAEGRFSILHFSVVMKERYDLAEHPTLAFCRRVIEASGLMVEKDERWIDVEAA